MSPVLYARLIVVVSFPVIVACAPPDDVGALDEASASSDESSGSEATTSLPDSTADSGSGDSSTSSPSDPTGDPESDDGSADDGAVAGEGTIAVLTYNVAGLPDLISGGNPAVNSVLISPLLNAFDLVLVQEDFSYHAELSSLAEHPYQSTPGGTGSLGDGLNRFSNAAFVGLERHAWLQCNGVFDSLNDCLTDKGFSVAMHELESGAVVDVYNLHMDAGGSAGDKAARKAQVQQMLARISLTPQRALIVAGDTNMHGSDEADLQTLLVGAGLSDACRFLQCGDSDRIDRVMFRSSPEVELAPTGWRIDATFVDGSGYPLSDHLAVAVDFAWSS